MDYESGLKIIDAVINDMAPPPVESLKQIIIARRAALKQLKSRGHTWDAIAAQLSNAGISISGTTLKLYVLYGKESKAAAAVKEAKAKRPRDRDGVSRDAPAAKALPANATQATAGGGAVIAHKVL